MDNWLTHMLERAINWWWSVVGEEQVKVEPPCIVVNSGRDHTVSCIVDDWSGEERTIKEIRAEFKLGTDHEKFIHALSSAIADVQSPLDPDVKIECKPGKLGKRERNKMYA